jgi:hypothetical protein
MNSLNWKEELKRMKIRKARADNGECATCGSKVSHDRVR